jgi:protein-L-isoaspartate(D-aspartate) O-methyltransferase
MNANFDNERRAEREAMVREQIASRGIRDARVLEAMRRVPRHRFVPPDSYAYSQAYEDGAQAIGEGQTISQPFIVALMTDVLELRGDEKVLEIGAGSGYQTAILSLLCASVIAIERHPQLAERARTILDELEITNVQLHIGDGSRGWPSDAPYEVILVAAVAPEVPLPLIQQLAPGGRMVLPVGPESAPQRLQRLHKLPSGTIETRDLGEVAFVPLIGAQGYGLPADLGDLDI